MVAYYFCLVSNGWTSLPTNMEGGYFSLASVVRPDRRVQSVRYLITDRLLRRCYIKTDSFSFSLPVSAKCSFVNFVTQNVSHHNILWKCQWSVLKGNLNVLTKINMKKKIHVLRFRKIFNNKLAVDFTFCKCTRNSIASCARVELKSFMDDLFSDRYPVLPLFFNCHLFVFLVDFIVHSIPTTISNCNRIL